MSDDSESTSLRKLGIFAVALVTLAAVTLMGIAVINGFKDTNLVDNTTADNFITGLALFGSFSTVIAIALVGKLVIGLFKRGM